MPVLPPDWLCWVGWVPVFGRVERSHLNLMGVAMVEAANAS
ncbi:hypothetical protein [Leptolyngbya sp. UWPOB_LEPTO1]|nr:hypothetical protein [Leptolyngbya sp. UWPOB_LEPTO1]